MQAGAMKMKCMADGGLVGTIKGMMGMRPAETVTQKYARQDAERAAKATAAAPAPAPAQQSAISDYASMGAMKRREAAAGMKHGGKVKGPGTGTSDSVPAMLSKGEYVMPADSVRHFGVKTLEAMRKATHTPTKMGAKKGAVRKMADGGMVEDPRRQALISQIPLTTAAPSVAAQPQVNSTELGRNVSNTLSALPGAAPALGAIRTLSAASSALPSAAGIVGKLASVAAPVAPYAPVVGGVAAINAGANPPAITPPAAPVVAASPTPSMPGTPAAVAASAAPVESATPPGLGARGPISSQNMGAADNLAARYSGAGKAQYDQEVADAAATNAAGGFNTGQPQTARSMILAQLAGKKLTGKGARVLSELDRTDAQTATATAANKLAQDKLGVERTTAGADARLKGAQATTADAVNSAQARLAAAKTDAERAAAAENLRVVQGHSREIPELYSTSIIPGSNDPLNPRAGAVATTNRRTGEVTIKAVGAATPTVKTQAEFDKLASGETYTGKDGKTYRKP